MPYDEISAQDAINQGAPYGTLAMTNWRQKDNNAKDQAYVFLEYLSVQF